LRASVSDLIHSVKAQGLEGLVAKRRNSRCEPGLRSGAWQKRRINQGQELVIGGYTPSDKNFDALVIGYYEKGKLLYAARTRNEALQLPSSDEYKQREIELEEPPRVRVFELCRFLANVGRELVLATAQERRISVLPDMTQIVQLEDWHHPNVVDHADRPRGSETFQQLAQVLTTGEVAIYHPSQPPNTHWRNWPDGGNL
jgi:hypothetical protein